MWMTRPQVSDVTLTNQRSVLRSRDQSRPIRDQYSVSDVTRGHQQGSSFTNIILWLLPSLISHSYRVSETRYHVSVCLKAWYINKSFVGPNNPQLYQCKHSDQLSHSHAHYDTKWWHDDIISTNNAKVMTPPHRLLVSSNHCRRRKAQWSNMLWLYW